MITMYISWREAAHTPQHHTHCKVTNSVNTTVKRKLTHLIITDIQFNTYKATTLI